MNDATKNTSKTKKRSNPHDSAVTHVSGKSEFIDESIKLIKELEKLKIDYVCVSSGGIYPITDLKIKKGYNVDLAEKIKKSTNINIRVSGKIEDLNYGKKIINKKKTDLVAIGRSLISNPNLIYDEDSKFIPKQYLRAFK